MGVTFQVVEVVKETVLQEQRRSEDERGGPFDWSARIARRQRRWRPIERQPMIFVALAAKKDSETPFASDSSFLL